MAGDKDPFFSADNVDAILNSALKGFIGGGTFGAPGAAVEAKRIKNERDRQIAERKATLDEQTRLKEEQQQAAQMQLGYTPQAAQVTPSGQVINPEDLAAYQQAQEQKAFEERAGTKPVEGYQPDMFQSELDRAQAQERVQGLPPTIDQALAGPPAQQMGGRDFTTSGLAPEQVPSEFSPVLDANILSRTGLKPQSGFFKKLLNKDMSKPEDMAAVRDILVQVRQNPNLSESTKEALEGVAMQAFGALAEQTNMVGPKGGITREANYGRVQPRPVPGVSGESAVVPSEQLPADTTAGTATPEETRVAPTGSATSTTRNRKAVQSSALETDVNLTPQEQGEPESTLSQEDKDAIQAELDAEMAGEVAAPAQTVTPSAPTRVDKRMLPSATEADVVPTDTEKVAAQGLAKAPKPVKEGTPEFKELGGPSATNFTKYLGKGYLGFAKQDIENIDDSITVTELIQHTQRHPFAKAAQIYMSKMPRMVDNLVNIAFDKAFDTPQYRLSPDDTTAADEIAFFRGMSGKNADLAAAWVYKNLSPEANEALRRFVRGFEVARDATTDTQLMQLIMSGLVGTKEKYVDETVKDYISSLEEDMANARTRADRRNIFPNRQQRRADIAAQEAFEKELVEAQKKGKKTKKFLESAIPQLSMPLHPAIVAKIMSGDLVGALRMLSAHPNAFIARAASRLANANLNTKLVIQDGLVDDAGRRVPGYYDPSSDTIYIDPDIGMGIHTLLHEAGHAATSHNLENPNSPLAKEINKLLDKIRGSLGSSYGATTADEFVAEAQSNPEFKALLQSINPDGKKFTAWDRLTNSIGNFFRRLFGLQPKALESAFDRIDNFIDALISPAPEFRDAGLLYAAANADSARGIFDRLGDAMQSLPGMTPQRADATHEFLKNTIGGNFRSFMLSCLPLNALADVAKQAGLSDAPAVDKLVNERSGYEYKENESIEPLVFRAEDFAKKNSQAQVDLFNDVVYDSTLNKVDPTKKRTDYKTPEEQQAWDELQKKWIKLGGAGKALYANIRDAYKAQYQKILDAIGERIDASVKDPERAKLIKRDIYERILSKGTIDPYFPLARYGKYWLSYSARDDAGQMEFFVEAFETERERARYMEELAKSGATNVEAFSNLSELNYRRVPSNSFVNGVLQVMELNKVPPEATEEVLRLFLTTLPETAFAQSFQRRKQTLGFNKDAIRAFRERSYRTSHQLASMKYAAKLNQIVDSMKDYARAVGKGSNPEEAQRDNRVINEYVKEFEKRVSYINNPTVDKWSQVATSFGFNMTLGFNISSAVINLTQVPLILLPHLGGKYGFGASTKALSDAYKIHLNSGFNREVEIIGSNGERVKQKAMPALDNYDFNDPKLPAAIRRLKTLARVAKEQGQLNRSQLYDILQVDERNNPLSKVNAASGWIFHHGERLNRQVSLIATYNLELNRLNTKPTKEEANLSPEAKEEMAANHAIYVAELTNGGISAAAAPRIAQSSLGKVLFMFKRYGVSMYYLLFKTAREALKNEDPMVRQAAMRQIAGTYGAAALFAGIQGLPLFGVAALVYNMFAGDDEDDFETATRKTMGEFMYKGMFNFVTNTEIASRTGLSDLIIRDSGKQDSQTFALSMMEMMGGPVYGVASKVERGLNMIRDGNTARGIENILPSALGNIMKSIRYATEGTRTLRGDPITGEVNAWNVAAQAFGFAPADYTRQLEINARQKGIDKTVAQEQTKLKRQYYMAVTQGDAEAKRDIREKLLELGAKHRGLDLNAGTVDDVLERSMVAQKRVTERMRHGVAYSPKMLKEIENNLKEYE